MEDKYDLTNLISATVEQKPIDFEDAFKSILINKINHAVEARKTELAQNMFNSTQSDEE